MPKDETTQRRPTFHTTRRDGLLGTVIEVMVDRRADDASATAMTVLGEIERLQRIFNWFDHDSELRRWSRGEAEPGDELAEVIDLAHSWKQQSGGVFDPGVGALVALWTAKAEDGRIPSQAELDDTRTVMGSSLISHNLNAIAKGWIVDQSLRRCLAERPTANIVVNAGGDLIHSGTDPIVGGIEDPKRPYDNVQPLLRVSVRNCALATSGGSRRGWVVAGRKYSHVIDPRTGWPVSHVASASVIAPDATTADAMATILNVMDIRNGIALGESVGVGCCIIDAFGAIHRNDLWRDAEAGAAP